VPELPDVTVYVQALRLRIVGRGLSRVLIRSPFLLRSVTPPDPPVEECEGRRVANVRRLGKRIVVGLEGDLSLVLRLMIAGRFRWKEGVATPTGRIDLAAFQFANPGGPGPPTVSGTLVLTEAGTKRRASLHLVRGDAALRAHDPGGVEPLECGLAAFAGAVRRESHTLKRTLTDPRLISGVGNAYSDEILHAARLSPLRLTGSMSDEELARLFEATRGTLTRWIAILREEFGLAGGGPGRFPGPGQITAFRPGFAVHGRYGKPCPVCGSPVQRIVHAENETNYCARCQTGGRVLADRSLSRLLKDDWPRSIDELDSAGPR
jgi:formamidopyrimidine-DNA glycosylase